MIVAGQTIYVVTSAKDINAVWANSKTISMDPLTMDMYAMAGITEKCRKKMFTSYPEARYNTRNAKPMTPTQMTIDLHHQQLHRGQKLDAMMNDKVISRLLQDLDFSAPNHPAVKARSGSTYSVSLYNLSVHAFITADTDAFWGSKLRQIIPDFIPAFEDWEQTNWKLLFQLPAPFAKDMLQARETIAGGFAKYYSLPRYERPEASYFSKNVEDVLREVGLTEGEMGCFMLLHYWA